MEPRAVAVAASTSAAASIDLELVFLASGGAGAGGRRECRGTVAECLAEDEESELGSASAESHSAPAACTTCDERGQRVASTGATTACVAPAACAAPAGRGARRSAGGEEGSSSEREIGERGRGSNRRR
ncbi:rapid alkalinization factor-like [Panicum miliaceum]|uniref:Rapid alkalinization factor-like n=1 Tax=Panicum miliaceum TaxID=4540 RepID=A0A3L6SFZ3_PANMI|nr:rapid alkalinization factor-like [Panicum miliaceum]